MKLRIWCNADLPASVLEVLRDGVQGHDLVLAAERTSNLAAGGPSASIAGADVAFGQPDPQQVISLPELKWVHITSAGYTRYDRQSVREALQSRSAVLTNSSAVFADPCAQHVLAFMLAFGRQLPGSWADQAGGRTWAFDRLRPATFTLGGQTILLLSFGAIARRLTELLAPFDVTIRATRRTVHGDEPIPVCTMADAGPWLAEADHIVNILPSSEETDGSIDDAFFSRVKPGAYFYNIGRGTTVAQPALLEALEAGRLAGAYLDVTDPEPLPADHPLWSAPNCYITPHIAGGHQDEALAVVQHFLKNLRRYEAGQPLLDRVF